MREIFISSDHDKNCLWKCINRGLGVRLRFIANGAESNVDFVRECAMNRATGGGLHQLCALLGCKWTREFDPDVDSINHPLFGQTFFAVIRVNS